MTEPIVQREAVLVYSDQLVRRAVFAFWRRSVGMAMLLALAIVGVSLAVLVADGDRSWVVGVLATTFAMGVAMSIAVYVVHIRNSMNVFRELGDAPASFRADETSFTVASARGSGTLQWSAVKELWQFPGFWLLLYSKAQFSTLPLECIPPELQAYIAERVVASGGRVRG